MLRFSHILPAKYITSLSHAYTICIAINIMKINKDFEPYINCLKIQNVFQFPHAYREC